MAIQRCPYCKAIIDEGAEYCTNCGTKLLFPEDEFVEEEIPGEQIIDVDEDMSEAQQELKEPQWPEVTEEQAAEEEAAVEEAAEEETVTETQVKEKPAPKKRRKPRKKPAPKKAEAEEAAVEDAEAKTDTYVAEGAEEEGAPEGEEIEPEAEEVKAGTEEVKVVDDESPTEVDEEWDQEPVPEEELTPQPGAVDEKEWQTPPPAGELQEPGTPDQETVETGDIEEIVDEAEKEKEEIDKFIASVKKERQAHAPANDETQDIPPWVSNVEDGPLPDIPPTDEVAMDEGALQEPSEEPAYEPGEEPVEQPIEEPAEPPFEESPEEPSEEPQKTPVVVPLDQVGELSGEDETTDAPAPGYDTRSAFPETVDQQGLPFVSKSERLDDMDTADGAQYEESGAKRSGAKREVQAVGFIDWLKARAFDVVFVTALWFVALWIASQVLSVSVFSILSGSAFAALLFLAILLAIYFFYFLFFLGETLGNYLFSSEE
jgi:hypothetical protein